MVEILDAYGQPIRRAPPQRQEQTARLGHLHREIAEHPTRGLTPQKLAGLYRRAEEGDLTAQAQLGMDMEEKDAHLYAELSKRRLAILGVDWHLEPPENPSPVETSATELCAQILAELDVADLLYDMSDAILHAYAGLEYHWRLVDGVNVPTQPVYRQPDWFQADHHGHDYNRLLLRDAGGTGEALRPLNWLLHIHRARSGYLTRAGLVRVLGWPFLMRALSTRDLAEFLEIYGLPLRLGKYPGSATDDEKATLLRAVVGIGHAAAGIIPEGMMIEFKEAAKGAADPFRVLMDWAEGSISKAILGGTLTTTAAATGLGSNQADVQNAVRGEIRLSDCRQIGKTLEMQLLRPIVALNTTAARAPRWVWDLDDPDDLEAFSKALPALVDIGLRIPEAWAHERLKIPLPGAGEAVLGRAAPGLAAGRQAAQQQGRPPATPAELIAARLAAEGDPAVEAWVEHLAGLVEQADSLEALRGLLLAAYGDLPDDELGRVLTASLLAAEAAGRFDLAEESG